MEGFLEKYIVEEENQKHIKEIYDYVGKHKIQEMFNELLAHVLMNQPHDINKFLIQMLETAKKGEYRNDLKEKFLVKEDFETMFETYDLLNIKYVTYKNLVQALDIIGVPRPVDNINKKYKDIINENTKISKDLFVDVLMKEYKTSAYSY